MDTFAGSSLCSRYSNSKSTFVTEVIQAKKLPPQKHQCPVAAPVTAASGWRQMKRSRIHYHSSTGKEMFCRVSSIWINTNQFVKKFAYVLCFFPCLWSHMCPDKAGHCCFLHRWVPLPVQLMLLVREAQRPQGLETVSKARHSLNMLKGHGGVLHFLLRKNEVQCKQHRESWSQITPPHNLVAPHNMDFLLQWTIPSGMVLQESSHSPCRSKGLPASSAFCLETL